MKRWQVIIVLGICAVSFSTISAQERELTVEECVQIALKQNPNIIRGEFTVKIAGKDVTVAMSNFLPRVTSGIGYDHSLQGPRSSFRIDPNTGLTIPITTESQASWYSSAYISVNQTIFDGGYSIFNYSQSRSMKESAEYTFEDTKQTTILLV
jgi:outer membrane protein TolC